MSEKDVERETAIRALADTFVAGVTLLGVTSFALGLHIERPDEPPGILTRTMGLSNGLINIFGSLAHILTPTDFQALLHELQTNPHFAAHRKPIEATPKHLVN